MLCMADQRCERQQHTRIQDVTTIKDDIGLYRLPVIDSLL
jgi:hypothetical protein